MTLNLEIDWRAWKLEDWNRTLVQKIFFDEERLNIPITRINASDRFLADCVGEEASGVEVRHAFIKAFGDNVRAIKNNYVWSPKYKVLVQQIDTPTFLPALYLTLLAASADNNTLEHGQFRDRFSELLKPLEVGTLSFTDLPKFWKLASNWSRERNQRLGDCRVLQLPDPLHESLIGHSKRLVFPTYRDEKLLKIVLENEGLNSSSDFGKVSKALHKSHHKFSSGFIEELNIFNSFITKAYLNEAYDSPLWGAIRDILWEEEKKNSIINGSLLLELHPDLYSPEFSFLTDVYGMEKLSSTYQLIEFSKKDKYQFRILTPESENLIFSLKRIIQISTGFKTTKLWKAYTSELIPFFPNERGYLTTEGVFSDGVKSCFLVNKNISSRFTLAARSLRSQPSVSSLQHIAPEWELLTFESLSLSDLNKLSALLPLKLQGLLSVSWKPPTISLSGGAWFGQTLLLNPSSNPIASLPQALTGTYELLDKDGQVTKAGVLDRSEDGYVVPYVVISCDMSSISKVRYSFAQANSLPPITKVVSLIHDIPLSSPIQLPNKDAWLVIGRSGRLQNLSTIFNCVDSENVQKRDLNDFSPYLLKYSSGSLEPLPISLNEQNHTIPDFLNWIGEALALRFQGRLTIPYRELMAYLTGPALILDIPKWQLRNLLFLGCRIIPLESRRSAHLAITSGIRTISLSESNKLKLCRIVGGLSISEIFRLRRMLSMEERLITCLDTKNVLSISALEVKITDEKRIMDFAKAFNLQILERSSFNPILTPFNKFTNPVSKFQFPQNDSSEFWDILKRQWKLLDRKNPVFEKTIVRIKGGQRNRFWIISKGISIESDSEVWAKIFLCAVLDQPIAQIQQDGTCVFNNLISALPESLTRWWLHWGGGAVAYSTSKNLIFSGSVDPKIWSSLGDWVKDGLFTYEDPVIKDYAISRRMFALKKTLNERNKNYSRQHN